jgi:hypothetical protein
VIDVPTFPDGGDKLRMLGAGTTVKLLPLLLTPLAKTRTFPVVAPDGTVATMALALQLVTDAAVPLNVMPPFPCVGPKFAPLIVTDAPTAPLVGERLVILGAGTTVKFSPLLSTPLACTTTFPVVAPEGTFATIELALQLVVDAVVPLNLTVLLPFVEPKFDPEMVIDAPTAPDVEDKLVITGAGTTVKVLPLLFAPDTITITLPVVAPLGTMATILVELQLVMLVAVVPLNLTVLLPCVDPKLLPEIVTDAPTAPDVGERLVIEGAAKAVEAKQMREESITATPKRAIGSPFETGVYYNLPPLGPLRAIRNKL